MLVEAFCGAWVAAQVCLKCVWWGSGLGFRVGRGGWPLDG